MPPRNRILQLGTSGWSHRDWAGKLYPHDMAPADYLTAYAELYSVVEIESTFYDIPPAQHVQAWYRRSPTGFLFSPCIPRAITHAQPLHHALPALQKFLSVISELGDKLGPLLLQLPEPFRSPQRDQLEWLLDNLPTEFQYAIEFRHGTWLKDITFDLLEAHQIAWVVVDAAFLPKVPRVTAPFSYVRWHGRPGVAQRSRNEIDPVSALQPWVPILQDLQRQSERVYGFVRNSFSGYAPRDCNTLLDLTGESSNLR